MFNIGLDSHTISVYKVFKIVMMQKLKLGVNKEVVELSTSWVEGIRIQYCARYAMACSLLF
jgi:hypothetical protein